MTLAAAFGGPQKSAGGGGYGFPRAPPTCRARARCAGRGSVDSSDSESELSEVVRCFLRRRAALGRRGRRASLSEGVDASVTSGSTPNTGWRGTPAVVDVAASDWLSSGASPRRLVGRSRFRASSPVPCSTLNTAPLWAFGAAAGFRSGATRRSPVGAAVSLRAAVSPVSPAPPEALAFLDPGSTVNFAPGLTTSLGVEHLTMQPSD